MNKKLYTLFALGTLLFAACSDNASISGSTNIPNMVNPDNVMTEADLEYDFNILSFGLR